MIKETPGNTPSFVDPKPRHKASDSAAREIETRPCWLGATTTIAIPVLSIPACSREQTTRKKEHLNSTKLLPGETTAATPRFYFGTFPYYELLPLPREYT
ncbi:hypothetical protein ISCGN_025872 [Ixodes scapularis]